MSYQPIFLIGAARSGTKILRDTISTHPEVEKIGYDINFIWKRYNEDVEHDELSASDAKPKFKKFIRNFFKKKAKNSPFLIEKTVGNTLRIPFLLEVFPEAKFIILYRDGRDVIESVVRQWGTAPDNSYLFKKLMSIPVLEVLPFLFKYGVDTLKIKLKLATTKKYVWGVRHKDFQNDLAKDSVVDFCTKQWMSCAQAILDHKGKIKAENKIEVRYENLVTTPKDEFLKIASFLGLNEGDFDYSSIKPTNIGKSKTKFPKDVYSKINNTIKPTLDKLGYGN